MKSWDILLVTALVACFAVWQYERAESYLKERDDYKQQVATLEDKVKTVTASTQKVVTKAQSDRLKVKEVLDEAQEFRDTPTPEPVRNRLCEVIRCK